MKHFRHPSHAGNHPASALWPLASVIALAAFALSAPALSSDAIGIALAPSFQIQSPTSTTSVRSPVAVDILLHGATIGSPRDGLDHLHIAVDRGEVIPIYKMPVEPLALAPGQHTLDVELAGPNHRPIAPAQTITFTVQP